MIDKCRKREEPRGWRQNSAGKHLPKKFSKSISDHCEMTTRQNPNGYERHEYDVREFEILEFG
jgi:hypothetical protein